MLEVYSFFVIALCVTGVISGMAISAVSKNSKELTKTVLALSGKTKEYAEIKSIDKAHDVVKKKVEIKKPEEPKDKLEDMLL